MAQRTLTIVQHNVLHWSTRKYELYNSYREEDPDIILINSHGQPNNNPIKIFDYTVYQNNPTDTNNDGVAIAIKTNIPHTIIDDLDEAYIGITVTTTLGPVLIATGYQPPRRPALPITNFLRLFRRQCPVFFLGDLNARHKNFGHTDNNTAGKMLSDLINNGTVVHTGPDFQTYITPRASGSPDVILTNQRNIHQTFTRPGPLTTSDHIPIVFQISSSPRLIPATARFNFAKANWEQFQNILQVNTPINLENQPSNLIDSATETWFNQVMKAMNESIPKSSSFTTPHPRRTPEIQAIQHQYLQLIQQANSQRWSDRHRKILKALQINLQQKYLIIRNKNWEEKITNTEASHNNPSKFWQNIKQLMGSNSTPIPYILNTNGEKITSEAEQEEIFRNHFKQIYKISDEEQRQYCQETDRTVTEYLHAHQDLITPYPDIDTSRLNPTNPIIAPITYNELLTTMKTFKNNKAPGISKINKTIISKLPDIMIKNLQHIYNASLSCGIFPRKFKKAILKLINKAGKNVKHPENYRPISLLEMAGKIYEKIINNRLRQFLESENKYHPHQHSFRRERGTHTAISLIYENIAKSQGNREHCTMVLRDVSKAFDKVWHDGLKFKLIHLGLPRCLTALLCNFLDNRTASIHWRNHAGPDFPLKCGVPQGSVLSPTLYNIYTADMPLPINATNTVYADDVTQQITYPGKSKNMLKHRTIREINRLNSYEKKWKIKTNQNKFQMVYLSKQNPPPINIDGHQLNYRNEATVLGLKINTRGFIPHIRNRLRLAKEASKKLKRFTSLTSKTKLHLVKALVIPHLLYPPTPLYAASKSNLMKLQRILNSNLRWVNGDAPPYHNSIKQLHEKWNITPINIKLFEQNFKVWEKIRNHFPDQYENLTINRERTHQWWPSSIITEDNIAPEPIYIIPRRPRADEDPEGENLEDMLEE